jgi:hypothetical protein
MTASPNKGLELQATGSNSGTWGAVNNDNVISYIDQNLGGRTALTLSSSNVTLTAAESRDAILYLSGVLTANITITTECIGFFYVENRTTGSFTVTVRNNLVAPSGSGFSSTVAVVARNSRVALISDSVQGVRIAGQNGFASGDALISASATAPIGYTISTSVTNAALRLVSGAAGGTGGTTGFTAVFTSRTISKTNLPDYTLPDTFAISGSQTGGMTRNFSRTQYTVPNGSNATVSAVDWDESTLTISGSVTLDGGGTAMDFAVNYLDVNNIVKD